ncbi:uncharacterized protein L969DRAFT_86766 [Mixia osmundae IAM 14324]|uniref:Protein MON2 homolog n=1 Tax=Mixia osmundae (strain CBS 9802 / IAM 14324 / JCM 22182 / KY 12970) TaxID=764103 RepID=G7E8N9_MIXOS|nr:uncharacterized protein L969DRAFT_86766 [Mixia osmundae IAM 14324]KEI40143.1 hypothetical protein L969DRAFT_86766 [Mixia osmundae IAM 14324]GAA99507.1 hypothetical protein E5Q_06208 [Mixia osmundae IAM 14324]
MASLSFLTTELQLLSVEAKRKNPEVKDAADKALTLLRTSPEQALADLRQESAALAGQTPILLQPILLGCQTRVPKVVAISIGSLQRLVGVRGAITSSNISPVLQTLRSVLSQGVEIQLKILQTLVSLLTTANAVIHGEMLAELLLLSFRLQESKIGVVSSTAAATLRQLVMIIYEGVVQEDRTINDADDSVQLDGTSFQVSLDSGEMLKLGPSAHDAYLVFQDLCLLVKGEPAVFLQLKSLPRTFGLELVESVLSDFWPVFKKHPELLNQLRTTLSPLLITALAEKPTFSASLRLMRVIFLLLKQFNDDLVDESEVFLSMFVRILSAPEADQASLTSVSTPTIEHPPSAAHALSREASPPWMRILALEIFRGLCSDFELLRKFWNRYDAAQTISSAADRKSTSVFLPMISSFNRLATERPQLLGVGAEIMSGSSSGAMPSEYSVSGMLDGMVEMATQAANSVGVIGTGHATSLSASTAAMKLQCIDQLDKSDAPPIPETYQSLLTLHCLVSIANGLANFVLPLYNTQARQRPRSAGEPINMAQGVLDLTTLESDLQDRLKSAQAMSDAGWPALLASLSFFVSANIDEELFHDTLKAMQAVCNVCGVLGLQTPRDAFLTSLCKFAIPPAILTSLITSIEPSKPANDTISPLALSSQPMMLSLRNLACLKALLNVAQFLAGSLDAAWFHIFATLANADFVLRTDSARRQKQRQINVPISSTSSPMKARTPSSSGQSAQQLAQKASLYEADAKDVHLGMTKVFDASKTLEDEAFRWFIAALCRLNGEMLGLAVNDLGEPADLSKSAEPAPAESPVTAKTGRRRQADASVVRILRQGESSFAMTKICDIAVLNIHRLIYRDARMGWSLVTSHLLAIAQWPEGNHLTRTQAADALDQILAVAPRNVSNSSEEHRSQVQEQVLLVLAQQASPQSPPSSTDVEVRRLSLETLFKIIESSGHSFVGNWHRVFTMLRAACPLNDDSARVPALVRMSFPSLQLICSDFLASLDPQALHMCVDTLADYAKQTADINVALTSGGLLWNVSDHIQGRRSEDELGFGTLWLTLLARLLTLQQDERQEVRDGSIQTLYRCVLLYGGALDASTWDKVLWDIIFPLFRSLSSSSYASASRVPEQSVSKEAEEARTLLVKQWSDSRILAMGFNGQLFHDYILKIANTERFAEAWRMMLAQLVEAYTSGQDAVATAAMTSLGKMLAAPMEDSSSYSERLGEAWQAAWDAWASMGALLRPGVPVESKDASFSQATLRAFVEVAKPLLGRSLLSLNLQRSVQVLAIMHDVQLWNRSDDYRPDVDSLTNVQQSVLEVIDLLDLSVPGVSSRVLVELSDYATFAYTTALPSPTSPSPVRRLTFVALAKDTMPRIGGLYTKHAGSLELYTSAAVEHVLAAFAIPMKLKYECPPPAKFGNDLPLWKTATNLFMDLATLLIRTIVKIRSDLPPKTYAMIWQQLVSTIAGGLLADNKPVRNLSSAAQIEAEEYDRQLLNFIEASILPHVSHVSIEDTTLLRLATTLQNCSRLYDLILPSHDSRKAKAKALAMQDGASEARFAQSFEEQAAGHCIGTTAEIEEVTRPRWAFWSFNVLAKLVAADPTNDTAEASRMARLALPIYLSRCIAAVKTYIADATCRGKLPFPRIRVDELSYVMKSLLDLELREGCFQAAFADHHGQKNGKATHHRAILVDELQRSPAAHLFHIYPLLLTLNGMTEIALTMPPPVRQKSSGMFSRRTSSNATATLTSEPRDARTLSRLCLERVGRTIALGDTLVL